MTQAAEFDVYHLNELITQVVRVALREGVTAVQYHVEPDNAAIAMASHRLLEFVVQEHALVVASLSDDGPDLTRKRPEKG
ncbi:MAG: hypothetical protein ABJX32_06225 [Tateyamaria sp.]|uniref:hypothetical protein n=1 Tax=Tateyamaria sp. TaxID=1929288 RepID=UPI00329BA46A